MNNGTPVDYFFSSPRPATRDGLRGITTSGVAIKSNARSLWSSGRAIRALAKGANGGEVNRKKNRHPSEKRSTLLLTSVPSARPCTRLYRPESSHLGSAPVSNLARNPVVSLFLSPRCVPLALISKKVYARCNRIPGGRRALADRPTTTTLHDY